MLLIHSANRNTVLWVEAGNYQRLDFKAALHCGVGRHVLMLTIRQVHLHQTELQPVFSGVLCRTAPPYLACYPAVLTNRCTFPMREYRLIIIEIIRFCAVLSTAMGESALASRFTRVPSVLLCDLINPSLRS